MIGKEWCKGRGLVLLGCQLRRMGEAVLGWHVFQQHAQFWEDFFDVYIL